MTKILLLQLMLAVSLSVSVGSQTNSWHGITPLQSSREDVEKLLGRPAENRYGLTEYQTKSGKVHILYVSERCDQGWDVSPNIVLQISASDIHGRTEAEVGLVQGQQFQMPTDTLNYRTWIDPSKGRSYHFETTPRENRLEYILTDITYLPTRNDNRFRCDGFPPYSPERDYFTMDVGDFLNSKTKLRDDFNTNLAEISTYVGNVYQDRTRKAYVVIYFDKIRPFKFYKRLFDRLVKRTYSFLKVSPSDLVFVEGGLRDKAQIEYYLLPRDFPPPAPTPTLPSPEFMRIKGKRRQTDLESSIHKDEKTAMPSSHASQAAWDKWSK